MTHGRNVHSAALWALRAHSGLEEKSLGAEHDSRGAPAYHSKLNVRGNSAVAETTSMPTVGDVIAGKYTIEKVIGEGGMGAVYSATHNLTGKRVAIKWMLPALAKDEDAVRRFLREAQAAGRISHRNVVDIYDVGEHDGTPFLVMEFLRGEPLTAALERGGLSVSQVIALLIPAMRGVAAAHRMGVVHRDLKPDNIFLCNDEHGNATDPKVLDFGISKVSANDGVSSRLTKTGAVMGTPYYMSPEQIRGSAELDKRSDVYAFGVILYEALTGRVPFSADTYSALILEIATGVAKPPRDFKPELPEDLDKVVMTAMSRELPGRYTDLESLMRDLMPFLEGRAAIEVDPTGQHSLPRATGAQGAQRGTGAQAARAPTGANRSESRAPGVAQTSSNTTPFASEIPTIPKSGFKGVYLAVAAVLLLGGAALVMGRGGSDTEAAASPAPAEPMPAPAPAPELAPAELPAAATPQPATPTPAAEELPRGASIPDAMLAPAPEVTKTPTAPSRDSDGHRSRKERRNARPEPTTTSQPAPSAPAPVVAPAPAPRPTPRTRVGRTGGLDVNEF
jgi:serine/threonine protein kinase